MSYKIVNRDPEPEPPALSETNDKRDQSLWLTALLCLAIVSIILKLLEVNMVVIGITSFLILFTAVVLNIIRKESAKREADRRAAKIKSFVDKQL